jgi:hypothetical protein
MCASRKAYLNLFLVEIDLRHDIGTFRLVRLRIGLIRLLKDRMVLGTARLLAEKLLSVYCGDWPGSLALSFLQARTVVEEDAWCASHVASLDRPTDTRRHGGSLCRVLSYHASERICEVW